MTNAALDGGASAGQTRAIGHEHPDVSGGWLRPAVFGAMDGLVSNFALIAGVVGGTQGQGSQPVVLAGLAGLAAGAFSMAAGEYTSVASQAEFAAAEVAVERREIIENGPAEEAELARMYVAKGIRPELAAQVAHEMHLDVDRAVDAHAREELGIDPNELPSASLAAFSSFLSFSVGASLPVLPYLLSAQTLWPALVVSLLALFLFGAVVTRVTNRGWLYGGLRQMVLGGAAAAVTYSVGSLVGASFG